MLCHQKRLVLHWPCIGENSGLSNSNVPHGMQTISLIMLRVPTEILQETPGMLSVRGWMLNRCPSQRDKTKPLISKANEKKSAQRYANTARWL